MMKKCSNCKKEPPSNKLTMQGKPMRMCFVCYTNQQEMRALRKKERNINNEPILIWTQNEVVDEIINNRNDSFSERYNRVIKYITFE